MTSKSSALHGTHRNGSEYPHDAHEMADMTREQLALTEDWIAHMFRASESLQRTQQQFSQRAALLHSQTAENLRNATNPNELARIQSGLAMSWMQESVRFYQDMMLIGTRLGSETLRPGKANAPETLDDATSAAASAANAAMNAAAPMMQAWQMLWTAPLRDHLAHH
jgi:hypothetical protein